MVLLHSLQGFRHAFQLIQTMLFDSKEKVEHLFQPFLEFDLKYFGTSMCIGDMVTFSQSGVYMFQIKSFQI